MARLTDVLLDGGDLAIATVSGSPVGVGTVAGQLVLQIGPDSRSGLWQWDGSAWQYHPIAPIQKIDPPGSNLIEPDGVGQEYLDTLNSKLWIASSSEAWTDIHYVSGGGGGS